MSEYIQLFCRELEEMKSRESCLLTFEVERVFLFVGVDVDLC